MSFIMVHVYSFFISLFFPHSTTLSYPSKIPFKTVYVQLRLLSVYICTDGEQILQEEEEKQTYKKMS